MDYPNFIELNQKKRNILVYQGLNRIILLLVRKLKLRTMISGPVPYLHRDWSGNELRHDISNNVAFLQV